MVFIIAAFSTVAEPTATADEIRLAALRAGIDHVEVRLDGQNRFFSLEGDALDSAIAAYRDSGVRVVDLGTNLTVKRYDPSQFETVEIVAALCRKVGAKAIRVFPGHFYKSRSERPAPDPEAVSEQFSKIAKIAFDYGIEIWIETHNEYATGAELLPILDRVDAPNLKVIWDVMHTFEQGEAPAETIRLIGNRIAHVHIKDGIPRDDPDAASYLYTKLGEGIVPNREAIALLSGIGYRGCLSLEWEKQWRPELSDTYASLDDVLAAYRKYLAGIAPALV